MAVRCRASGRLLVAAALFVMGLSGAAVRAQTVETFVAPLLNTPGALAFDPASNLYVLNAAGSPISMIAPDGGTASLPTPAGSDYVALAIDAGGTLYAADNASNTVVKFAPGGTVFPVAGSAQGISGPAGLAFDGAGNLYVSNHSTNTISKITPAGVVSLYVDATAGLIGPTVLAVDSTGALYVGSGVTIQPGNVVIGGILKISPGQQVTNKITGVIAGGLAVDGHDNLYASDGIADGIGEYSATGAFITVLASGQRTVGLAFDRNQNLLFSGSISGDDTDFAIEKLDGSGQISRIAGNSPDEPGAIVSDRNGGFYVATLAGAIDKIDGAGQVQPFLTGYQIAGMASDSAGDLYIASAGGVSKITRQGMVSSFAPGYTGPLTVDAQDNLYVADAQNGIVKIAPDGAASILASLAGYTAPNSLAADAGGTVYASIPTVSSRSGSTPGLVVKITPSGVVSTFFNQQAGPLVVNGAGDVFSLMNPSIDRIAPDGTATPIVTSVLVGPAGSLTIDPAGNLYLSDQTDSRILRVVLTPSLLLSAILPGSRSVTLGAPATVFATLLNTGATALTGCQPALPGGAATALSFSYQRTDPVTNAATGTPNQPVTIAAHGGQSFVLGFGASEPAIAPGLRIAFTCAGTTAAPVVPGVNTVDLRFDAAPVPDIIALAATESGNGVVTVPIGPGRQGAFAVATIDAGAAGMVTVSADTGSATLPVGMVICQTDPVTTQCLAAPAPSLDLAYAANATPTFSVFVTASQDVPFDPAGSRIFLRFRDAAGVPHGSTSVAVATVRAP